MILITKYMRRVRDYDIFTNTDVKGLRIVRDVMHVMFQVMD